MLRKSVWALCFLSVSLYSDTVAFTLENDFFGSREDNHYTNGAFLIWMQEEEKNHRFDFFMDDLQTNTALSLTHQIFTPNDKEATEPVWDDLPYAGYAKLNFLLYKSTANYFHEFGINIGAVGPVTRAQQLQDFFHKVVGDDPFKGWDNQLGNHVMAGVSYQFAYKTDAWDWHGYKIDSISNIRGDAGNFYTGLLVSTTLRLSSSTPKTFITAGNFMVMDESDLLNVEDSKGFNWDISFGLYADAIYNYYIIDEGIDLGYQLDPMRSALGWQGTVNVMYGSFKCTYKIKSAYINGPRDKRYGGVTLIWNF
jgi:hypothetical protein